MALLTSVNPTAYVKAHRPRVEPTHNVSGDWFASEKLTLTFGDDIGRPSSAILLQREYITRFLENGWRIESVRPLAEKGRWTAKATSKSTGKDENKSHNEGSTSNASNSTSASTNSNSKNTSSSSSSKNENRDIAMGSSVFKDSSGSSSEQSSEFTNSSSNSTTAGASDSENKGDTSTDSSSSNESTNESDASPYWYATVRAVLTRRRLQPEKVLSTMVNSFVSSYNNGRSIDNDRFNELVSLYSVVLQRNEEEGNALLTQAIDATDPTAFLDRLCNSTWGDFTAAHNKAIDISSDMEKSSLDDINRKFDNLIAQTKAGMVTNGTYNGTIWPTTLSGIERQRAAALAEARAGAGQITINALASVGSAKASAASAFLNARQTIQSAIDNRRVTAIQLRNAVVKWMLDFVGSREEVYPELEQISSMAERMGFSVGSAGNVI